MKFEEALAILRINYIKNPTLKRNIWKYKQISFELSHENSLKCLLNCDLFADDWNVIFH